MPHNQLCIFNAPPARVSISCECLDTYFAEAALGPDGKEPEAPATPDKEAEKGPKAPRRLWLHGNLQTSPGIHHILLLSLILDSSALTLHKYQLRTVAIFQLTRSDHTAGFRPVGCIARLLNAPESGVMVLLWHGPSAGVTGRAEERMACNAGAYGLFQTIRCEPAGFNARLLLDNTCLSINQPAASAEEPLQREDLKLAPLGAGMPSRPPLCSCASCLLVLRGGKRKHSCR